ncbi:hypothetical protein CFAM422_011480 [Trichoderma lentiforme]|uniref:Nephrocystin 3-like N-terminal domain-containing protein n=1 Tax=Trichoderma lentiforme TaxID=1567552 RepID=A0A9P5C7F8_9HYPO|nr:hypothetical protein CFAM422_011480 [Trichoderma lentiforme]
MEITGTIKTTIDLLKFLKNVVDFIKRVTSKTKMDEVAREIKADLSHVQSFLLNIKRRQERLPMTDQDQILQGLIKDIESRIKKIQEVLKELDASHKGHGRVLKRGRLVLGCFEKDLKNHGEKLDRLKQSLEDHMRDLEAQHKTFSQNLDQVYERFSFSLPSLRGRRLDGTLEWIKEHTLFRHWRGMPQIQDGQSTPSALPIANDTNPEGRVLIISGVVGCGKSVLAAYVVNVLKKEHPTLFFSFSTDFRDQRSTRTLLRALLSQTFQILPSERQRHHLSGLLDKTKSLNEPDYLIGMVVELAKEVESELYVIIDGIDESEDDWNQSSPGPLDHMETLLKANARMRLLLFGRRSSLRGALTRWSSEIELTSDRIKNDIKSFIASELKTCQLIERTRRDEIQKVLESKSANMYLWIKYIFIDLRTAGSEREIEEALNRRPDDLDRHYSRMLSSIMMKHKGESVRKRSKDLFALIIGASRPFTMVELLRAHAFALPLSRHASGYQANLLKPESVIEACGDFISVEDGVVQLVHTSMREFFLRPSHLWERMDEYDVEFFRLEHQDCHRMLGLSCLTYMKCMDGQTQTGSDQMEESINDNKFVNYASHHLFSHLLESNIALQDESLQIFELLKSGNASVLANMILKKEDESNRHIPIQFWDDACHFLGAWSYSDTHVRRALGSLPDVEQESISDLAAEYQDSEQLSRSFLHQLADYYDDNGSGAYGSDVGREAAQNGKRKGEGLVGASSLTANTHRLTSRAQDNMSVIMKNLPIGSLIGTMIQTRDLLIINPIDTVMTALASSIKKMSFFTLMLVGTYTSNVLCREKQALEIFQTALQRVIREKGTRTAWARIWVGNTSKRLDAEVHYREAIKILHASHMNPIRECLYLVAMGNLIRHKLHFGGRECLADLATQFNRVAVRCTTASDPGSGSHAGFLRDQCYRIIKSIPDLQRMKIEVVLEVAKRYDSKDLYEDLDELLWPFVDGTVSTSAINRRSFSEILGLWANAKAALGEEDVAIDTITCAKKRVSKIFLDAVRLHLARLFYNAGRFELAQKELSKMKLSEWFRSCVYDGDDDDDDFDITVDTLLGTYSRLGQAKKVSQILDEIVLAQGYIQGTSRVSSVVSPLLAHGLFSNSQELILKIMPKILANCQFDNAKKLNLYEALAFSARLQNGHEAKTASYNYYKECVKFAGEKLLDSDLTRVLIGMGAACVAASKPKEASTIFRKLAGNYLRTQYYRHFFLALACQQDGNSMEYHRLLSKVVSILCRSSLIRNSLEFDEQANRGSLHRLDEEEGVVLTTAYICLADASDTYTDSESAGHYRILALEVLQKKFASSLDPNSCPRMEDVSRWTSRWARSCQEYLNGSSNGRERSKDLPEMFPFEVWWGPDVGTDYFKHFDCSV